MAEFEGKQYDWEKWLQSLPPVMLRAAIAYTKFERYFLTKKYNKWNEKADYGMDLGGDKDIVASHIKNQVGVGEWNAVNATWLNEALSRAERAQRAVEMELEHRKAGGTQNTTA